MTLVGSPLPRVEDKRFLEGRGCYIDDLHIDGMLHAAILRSPYAHGRLLRIETAAALALPGVEAVITFADLPPDVAPIPLRIGIIPGFDRFLQLPLVKDKIRYVGEPLAVVIAASRYIAEDALDLIEIAVDELPAVTDWESASKPAAILHDSPATNIASSYHVENGDIAGAFEAADYRRRETFRCHRHTAMPMETRGLLAEWDAARGFLTVHGATKVTHANRRILATMIGLPEKSIDLIEVDVGGGFGVRGEFYPEDFLIPFAARKLCRPIKWIEDRQEHFLAANHSREISCALEIACRRDGTILAMRGELYADVGAYARTTGGIVVANAARCIPGPYRNVNFACDVHAFVTNKTPVGTYRGPGQFEANFFCERLIDIAAADLGIDPAEMRRHNLVPVTAMPAPRGHLVPYIESETVYDSGNYHAGLDRALAEIGWRDAKDAEGPDSDGWYHGVGIACFVSSSGVGPREHARLVLRENGHVDLHVGVSTLGQGHETVFAQICGDALGIPIQAITVRHGSTHLVENGFGTFHSRAVVMAGSATLETVKVFLEELRPLAARELGLPNAEIEWREGAFFTGDGRRSVGLEEIAAIAAGEGCRVVADGTFVQTKRTYTYGTHAAKVAVDPRTGKVKILDYIAVEDIGRAINPLLAHGQAIGGVVQALGGIFLEHLVYDKNGQLLTGSFADYKLPTASDFPHIRCVCLEAAPSPSNPLGAKGAGEGSIVPVAAAITNAVSSALARYRVQICELPLTLPRVWQLTQNETARS